MALTSYSYRSLSLPLFVSSPFSFTPSHPLYRDEWRSTRNIILRWYQGSLPVFLWLQRAVWSLKPLFSPIRGSISKVRIIQLLLTIDMLVLITQRSGFAEMNPFCSLCLDSHTDHIIYQSDSDVFHFTCKIMYRPICKLLFSEIRISLIYEQNQTSLLFIQWILIERWL